MIVPGGAFEGVEDQVSPFGYGRGEGVDAGHGDPEWICSKEKPGYDAIFMSLNPIDGKVTGAGMDPYTFRQLCARPHLRGTIIANKALDALLSTTQNCSQLTNLCMTLKEKDDDPETFNKIADALSIATQNSSMVAQFLANHRIEDTSRMSSAVSIHSLHDSLSMDGAGRTIDYKVETSTPDSTNDNIKNNNVIDDSDSDSISDDEDNEIPDYNLDFDNDDSSGFFEPIFNSIKFIFLLVLNLITIVITTQIMFITLAYIFTGEIFLELNIEKSPQSWFDMAKVFAFGPAEETIRIHSIFEVFHRQNVVNILNYFIRNINNNSTSVY